MSILVVMHKYDLYVVEHSTCNCKIGAICKFSFKRSLLRTNKILLVNPMYKYNIVQV
jgi:hypothetical protein